MTLPSYIKPKEKVEADLDEASDEAKLGKELMDLKDLKDHLESQLSETNAYIKNTEEKLAELMVAKKLDLFRSGGVTYWTKPENHPHVKKENLDAFIVWLDEHGHGAIAKRSVHPQTLKGWVNEELESGHALPKMVDNFVKTAVRTRRSNKK